MNQHLVLGRGLIPRPKEHILNEESKVSRRGFENNQTYESEFSCWGGYGQTFPGGPAKKRHQKKLARAKDRSENPGLERKSTSPTSSHQTSPVTSRGNVPEANRQRYRFFSRRRDPRGAGAPGPEKPALNSIWMRSAQQLIRGLKPSNAPLHTHTLLL